MYLLSTAALGDLVSRDEARPVFGWLNANRPGATELFASVVSFGIVASSIEDLPKHDRGEWRRLLQEGRRRFDLGEDERLVIATAIARSLTLVSPARPYLDEICDRTTLTVVNP